MCCVHGCFISVFFVVFFSVHFFFIVQRVNLLRVFIVFVYPKFSVRKKTEIKNCIIFFSDAWFLNFLSLKVRGVSFNFLSV